LVERGHEFGTNTGRRRRVGWFDAVMARQAARLNSLDRNRPHQTRRARHVRRDQGLRGLRGRGVRYDYPPYHQSVLHDVTPIYEVLPGWQSDITSVTEVRQLPAPRKGYVKFLEEA
jgi:adenylosuccinate synthase